jgi:hypothetical protein
VVVGGDAEPGRGRIRRSGNGIVCEHDPLRFPTRSTGRDDERIAPLDGNAVSKRGLTIVGDDGRSPHA